MGVNHYLVTTTLLISFASLDSIDGLFDSAIVRVAWNAIGLKTSNHGCNKGSCDKIPDDHKL